MGVFAVSFNINTTGITDKAMRQPYYKAAHEMLTHVSRIAATKCFAISSNTWIAIPDKKSVTAPEIVSRMKMNVTKYLTGEIVNRFLNKDPTWQIFQAILEDLEAEKAISFHAFQFAGANGFPERKFLDWYTSIDPLAWN